MPFGDSFYMSAGSFAAETIDNRRASGQLDDLIECETEHLPGSAESLRTDGRTNEQTNKQTELEAANGRAKEPTDSAEIILTRRRRRRRAAIHSARAKRIAARQAANTQLLASRCARHSHLRQSAGANFPRLLNDTKVSTAPAAPIVAVASSLLVKNQQFAPARARGSCCERLSRYTTVSGRDRNSD